MDQSARSGRGHVSALACFPNHVAREVAVAVVTTLGGCLGNPPSRSLLRTEAQVKWTMEVLCFSLSLPLDSDTVRVCVDIYTHWMSVLVSPRDSIPPPLIKEPNVYVQKILRHLRTLFMPRPDRSSPAYASVCPRVLAAVQLLAKEGAGMSGETWEMLLHFLICINQSVLDTLTSAPICQPLSLPSMEVLFQVSLVSCSRCFPPRSFWLSWRQMMTTWRFQPAALDQWTRVVTALTSRLLRLSFGPDFPHLKVPDEDATLIPDDMDHQVTLQTWFRFLHLISNPVDLKRPPAYGPVPPGQEDVFLTAMSTISRLVDAFLGVSVVCGEPGDQTLMNTGHNLTISHVSSCPHHVSVLLLVSSSFYCCDLAGLSTRIHFRDRLPSLGVAVTRSPFRDRLPSYGVSRPRSGSAPPNPVNILSMPSKSPPPPHTRQKTSNISKATGKPQIGSSQTSPSFHPWKSSSGLSAFSWVLYSYPRGPPSPMRGSVDSLLHLFGFCLFDAALVDKDSAPNDRWEDGRAEACGTLCRIFCCKKTSEDVLPVYLSRFYAVLLQGLWVCESLSPVVSSILLHSSSLFCCDLPGVNLLLPSFISILEKVLLEREMLSLKAFVSLADLRRASILVLMSLLPLPQQFGPVQLASLRDTSDDEATTGSFQSHKLRLIGLLMGSLQTEADSTNTQMLLAAVLTLVQDCALKELEGQTHQATKTHYAGHRGTKRTDRSTDQSAMAAVLWIDIVHLLTQHLTVQWRNDSGVCLVAMEILAGLARVNVAVAEQEKKRVVSSICRYIEFQCGRPPPLHSRELHSIIVVAFHCLSTWITSHHDILEDQECLLELFEIVELGVSGSKSRQEEEVRCREEKELNPVSLRVKEAAEATLNCIMQVSGASSSFGSSSDEDALIGCSGLSDRTLKKFRYFALDASVILGILEQDQGPEQASASCPSLMVLIRGQFSHHSWILQQRLHPREEKNSPKKAVRLQESGGGEDQVYAAISHCGSGVKNPLSLETINTVPLVEADMSIPDIWEGLTEEEKQRLNHLRATLEQQQLVEADICRSVAITTCAPAPCPRPATHVQNARLFLSHLGLVTPETVKEFGSGDVPAQLVSLDSSIPGFCEDLRRLDQLPFKTQDSAFIFYVRAGQKTATEILHNVESCANVSCHFLDFLSSLGRPVARRRREVVEFVAALGQSGGHAFDGDRFVLKYEDALTDITFIVPSSSSPAWSKQWKEADSDLQRLAEDRHKSKLMIVWVERLEDIEAFPVCELTKSQSSNCPRDVSVSAWETQVMFVHGLRSGLFRIITRGNSGSKWSLLPPLVDGIVVSRRTLGPLVMETMLNGCRRRQSCGDSAPPPHVNRKLLIGEMVGRYRTRRSEPADFYGALFQQP
ncbi:ral GTPase-activating protein subunit beta-like isoform X2 [Hippocampus zosterae]|uniref:ral GTPase-activating protein subunit beta-like isoform X2 n=1 Tax=Hippocampus zosterae TaxID=109293 RepID=UPI00223E6348|nr:ral GTPase-activating protein subunit beta-like isoform X2 [Hippocampus zosterae]